MTETPRLGLPLLMPSQAQKHVTANEALSRLDALTQLVLQSRSLSVPPAAAAEGECYAVPAAATGAWSGHDGEVAIFLNGGWEFVDPARGWRAFVEDEGALMVLQADWTALGTEAAPATVGPQLRSIGFEHSVSAGSVSMTDPVIPAFASVWGVTGVVDASIGGTSTIRVGVAGSDNRYGNGIGAGEGAWFRGLTGSPLTYWEDTAILLTAEDGAFDGTGVLRLLVHAVELPLP